jgi:adenosine deaminase
LKTIERKRICIECNPTSNYKIGEFTRYDQHPIFQFFNEGIETPYPKQGIYVSINTDDRGIFSTSLEREYSLIALALEKNEWMGERNTKRSVVNWLNEIRKMSLEQRFDTRMSLDERGPLINEKIEPKINRI